MIRKALIVALSLATLGMLYVLAVSFARDPNIADHIVFHGVRWALVDEEELLVAVKVECGRTTCLIDRTPLEHYRLGNKEARSVAQCKVMRWLIASVALGPEECHGIWGNMAIFDYSIALPNAANTKSMSSCVTFPLWCPLVVVGAYPIWLFVGIPLRNRSRRKRGECIHCGYNLTGLPEPRCPECGLEHDS